MRSCFDQYQASSAALGWAGDGECHLMDLCRIPCPRPHPQLPRPSKTSPWLQTWGLVQLPLVSPSEMAKKIVHHHIRYVLTMYTIPTSPLHMVYRRNDATVYHVQGRGGYVPLYCQIKQTCMCVCVKEEKIMVCDYKEGEYCKSRVSWLTWDKSHLRCLFFTHLGPTWMKRVLSHPSVILLRTYV